jgi:hypothetical protein
MQADNLAEWAESCRNPSTRVAEENRIVQRKK